MEPFALLHMAQLVYESVNIMRIDYGVTERKTKVCKHTCYCVNFVDVLAYSGKAFFQHVDI